MPDYKIVRHPAVDQDLLDILDLIAEYSGVETALQKLSEIEATIRNLAKTPHVGSLRHEILPNLRVIPAGRKGVVCFIVDDEAQEVLIAAIGYAGREWSQRIRQRR